MTLYEFQDYFNPKFEKLLKEKSKPLAGTQGLKENTFVTEHIQKLGADGKRVRPYLAFLAFKSAGGKSFASIERYLYAIELIHLFALIHDDVMDCAHVRRGIPTVHTAYQQKFHKSFKGIHKDSESIAILAGDLVYTWAVEQLFLIFRKNNDKKLYAAITAMLEEVVHGQIADIALLKKTDATLQELIVKNHLKTASYTFIRPLEIGYRAAGKTTQIKKIHAIGGLLGEGFQIQDDYLDCMGKPAITKKELCVDVEMGQPTLMTQYIFEKGTVAQKKKIKKHFGNPCTKKDKKELQILFNESGASLYAKDTWHACFDTARKKVEQLDVAPRYHVLWNELIDLLYDRAG